MMRALSYQALARGADAVTFFQWRASRAGAEKFHSAMVPHFDTGRSRVFAEVRELGQKIKQLTPVTGSKVPAKAALLFSYENLWALELNSKPALMDCWKMVAPWYQAWLSLNIPLDIRHSDDDLSMYKILIVPHLYQLTEEQAEALNQFVFNGGRLIMTYFSGIVDRREHIWLGGYPALSTDVLGCVVEEWQPFMPGESNEIMVAGKESAVTCTHWADLLHTTTTETLAEYVNDFYAGHPAVLLSYSLI
jgi:beta-galactosidase